MTMREFISENRAELSAAIASASSFVPRTASCYCPKSGTDHHHAAPKVTTAEIREWILNDEGMYRWARQCGVRV